MSSKEIRKNNEGIKSKKSSSIFNTKKNKEKNSSSKKVSFFNSNLEQQKESNPQFIDNSKNINEEDSDEYNSILSSDSYDQDRERQLEIVNEKFQKLFLSKEKMYGNIIKEINAEKKLFFKKSLMSFNLLLLKIKCLIKLLKRNFSESLKSKEYYEIDSYIIKIKKEFKVLYTFMDEESKYEYELTTQVYAKFLYLMGIISCKKEEYITSFSYICLGVNILKVFFIRQGVAKDIETYQIYAKLVVLLINKLISDNNLSQALLYINLLSRICEIALRLASELKSDKKYENKFNKYQSFGYLYMGFCYELNKTAPNNQKTALKAYKQAYYFMNKSPYQQSIFAELSGMITIEKKAIFLTKILKDKISDKLVVEFIEKQKIYEQKQKLKKIKMEEARNKEKKYRLKLIAYGVLPDNPNLLRIQEKIFTEILNPNNKALIDKLDDELISYVYKNKTDKNVENEDTKKEKKEEKEKKASNKLPSIEIMKNLCHYKMYNNLLSDDYKEFLISNRQLKFNCPQIEKNSLDKIQKYLNRKMEIGSSTNNNPNNSTENKENKIIIDKVNNKNKLVDKDYSHFILKTELDTNNSSESNQFANKMFKSINMTNNLNNNKINLEVNKTSTEDQNTSNNIFNNNMKQKKMNLYKTYRTPKHSYIISKEKEAENKSEKKKGNNNIKCITSSNLLNSELTIKNNQKKKTFNFPKNIRIKTSEPENRKVDKFIFNKKYFREINYFDDLINKELFFQKLFLDQKNANSKLYFKGYQNELENHGIIPREEILNSFLILNDKATSKERNYEKEMRIELEYKNKPKLFANMFKSVSKKMKEGKKVKNALNKVLDNYLLAQKKSKEKKKHLDKKEINKKNEESILNLNEGIKQLNYLMISKNDEMKRNKKKYHHERNLTQE